MVDRDKQVKNSKNRLSQTIPILKCVVSSEAVGDETSAGKLQNDARGRAPLDLEPQH